MAENQIKIKLVLDTSDSGKIKAELDKTVAAQREQNLYTQKQTELTRQVAARYNEVYEKVQNIANASKSFAQAQTRIRPVLVGFERFKAEAEAQFRTFAAELTTLNIPAERLTNLKLGNVEATARQLVEEKKVAAAQAEQYLQYVKLRNEAELRRIEEAKIKLELLAQEQAAKRLAEAHLRANLSIGQSLGRQTSNNVPGGFAVLGGATARSPSSGYGFAGSSSSNAGGTYDTTNLNKALGFHQNINKELPKTKEVTKEIVEEHQHWLLRLGKFVVGYRAINSAINAIKNTFIDVFQVGQQQQAAQAGLSAIFGTDQAITNMRLVQDTAQKTGQSFVELQQSYTRFATSAVLAGAKQEEVNQVFTDFSQVATVLKLSGDQVNSVFLALDQMYGKNKVQSEEIKKQLGNVLPGAVEIGARAWANYANNGIVNVGKFMDAMKKNLVDSQKFVPEFAKVYKKILAGPEGKVFDLAAQSFAAQLQRVRNEYTLIVKDIFNSVDGFSAKILQSIANSMQSIRENLGGIAQVMTTFIALFSFKEAVAGILVLTQGFKALEKTIILSKLATLGRLVFSPLNAILLGTVGLLTTLGETFGVFSVKYDKIKYTSDEAYTALQQAAAGTGEAAEKAKADLESLGSSSKEVFLQIGKTQVELSTIAEIIIEDLKSLLQELLSFGQKILEYLAKSVVIALQDISKFITEIVNRFKAGVSEIVGVYSGLKNLFSDKSMRPPQSIAEMYGEGATKGKLDFLAPSKEDADSYTSILKERFAQVGLETKKQVDEYFKKFEVEQKKRNQARQELLRLSNIPKPANLGGNIDTSTPEKAGGSKSKELADANRAFKASIENLRANAQESKKIISDLLNDLEEDYQQNLVSIESYYSQKSNLQKASTEIAAQELRAERELARQKGDLAKVYKADYDLSRLQQTAAREETKLTIAKNKAYLDLKLAISGVNSEYLKAQGKSGDASLVEFQTKYAELRKRLAADSSPSSQQAQQQLNELEGWTAAISKSQDAVTGYELAKSNLAIQEERIQNSLRSGAITELDSLSRLQDARREAVKQMEEYVKVRENALTNVPRDNPEVIRLQQIRNELENLKLETNLFATKFGTVFTQNFSNAFSAFATGAMTAKQAFASFAQGVIKNLADIAAQEASQQILKLVVSSIGSAFGGSSIGTAGFSSAGSAAISSFLSSGFTYGANGLAATGMAGASGTILDKPTYFPNARPTMFASGGVVAGEAGAEVVLPLRPGKDGKLGVVMQKEGSSETGGFQIGSIIVNVDSSKDASSKEQGFVISRAIEERLNSMIDRRILNAKRTGGALA